MKVLRSALATAALAIATIAIGAMPAHAGPGDDCPENYFTTQKMWEISWGRQYSDTNGTTTFNMQSNGGLIELNDGPVPAYMTPTWRWLYVSEPVQVRSFKYDFQDGTIRYANITPDANGCPAVEWLTFGPPSAQPAALLDVATSRSNYVCSEDHVTETVTTTTIGFVLDGQNNWIQDTPQVDTATADLPHSVEACPAGVSSGAGSDGAETVDDDSLLLPDTGATESMWQVGGGTASIALGVALILAARPQRTPKHALRG